MLRPNLVPSRTPCARGVDVRVSAAAAFGDGEGTQTAPRQCVEKQPLGQRVRVTPSMDVSSNRSGSVAEDRAVRRSTEGCSEPAALDAVGWPRATDSRRKARHRDRGLADPVAKSRRPRRLLPRHRARRAGRARRFLLDVRHVAVDDLPPGNLMRVVTGFEQSGTRRASRKRPRRWSVGCGGRRTRISGARSGLGWSIWATHMRPGHAVRRPLGFVRVMRAARPEDRHGRSRLAVPTAGQLNR